MGTIFHLIRHGRTVWNEEGRAQGHSNSPLTEKAIYETQQKATDLSQETFHSIYSSDLGRAQHTAEIIARHHPQLTIRTTPKLRERNFGEFEGKSFREYDAYRNRRLAAAVQADQEIHPHTWSPHPEMESSHQVATRVLEHLKQLSQLHSNQTILIVTHGGVLQSILVHLEHASHEDLQGKIKNLSRVVLEEQKGTFIVTQTIDIDILRYINN